MTSNAMVTQQHSPFLTVEEVASRLRRHPVTIKRMVRARTFAGVVQVGRSFRIPVEAIEDYEKRHTLPGPRPRQ